MSEHIFNLAPLIALIQNCLMILGMSTLLIIFIFSLFGYKNIKNLINHSNKLVDKYPLVDKNFYNLTIKEQNVENNQEIQELLEKQMEMKKTVDDLRKLIALVDYRVNAIVNSNSCKN